MKLFHVSKDSYSLKEDSEQFRNIISNYQNPLIVPEGGGNEWAITGVEELGKEIVKAELAFQYVAVAAGTGTTSRGLIQSSENKYFTIVINALKNESLTTQLASEFSKDSFEVELRRRVRLRFMAGPARCNS